MVSVDKEKGNAGDAKDKPKHIAVMDEALREWTRLTKDLLEIINNFNAKDSGSCLGLGFRLCGLLSAMDQARIGFIRARDDVAAEEFGGVTPENPRKSVPALSD